jgi:hypothetical protein
MARILAGGPKAGNRAAGLAFLALAAVAAIFLHSHLAERGATSFPDRLDAELLAQAELSLESAREGRRLEVVPSWPFGLYQTIKQDLLLYLVLTAMAAGFWSWSARARARRDAYLVHRKLAGELEEIRRSLDRAGVSRGAGGDSDGKG